MRVLARYQPSLRPIALFVGPTVVVGVITWLHFRGLLSEIAHEPLVALALVGGCLWLLITPGLSPQTWLRVIAGKDAAVWVERGNLKTATLDLPLGDIAGARWTLNGGLLKASRGIEIQLKNGAVKFIDTRFVVEPGERVAAAIREFT